MGGVAMLLAGTGIEVAAIVATDTKVNELAAQNGEVTNTGEHADEFIKNMPNGYYTEVDERGDVLSAGQRQLLSFARTMLSDPKILILDEATSSIDTNTEILVQEGINELLKNRTSFIVAHRLSTIKNCDRIMYISNGNIAESGSHKELMAMEGLYHKLYTSQLSID